MIETVMEEKDLLSKPCKTEIYTESLRGAYDLVKANCSFSFNPEICPRWGIVPYCDGISTLFSTQYYDTITWEYTRDV